MANFRDLLSYYRGYKWVAIFSIAATSGFELLDLLIPYAIGQILNVLSQQPLDLPIQALIQTISGITGWPVNQSLALGVLVGMIFIATIARAPIQPWLGVWYHWWISLRVRRDASYQALVKILSLPLEFYDEHNPGRIAARVAKGLSNHTWTYPEVAGQLIPKFVRVLGIVLGLAWLEWPVALGIFLSFVFVLAFTVRTLHYLMGREAVLDAYTENTESRTSEIITNIKTVKAFATENRELQRQARRLDREQTLVIERIHRGYVWLITWQSSVIQFCLFTVLGFSLVNTIGGRISLGHFITIYTLASMAYAELSPMSNLMEVFARRYASMLRFHELMELPSGADASDPQAPNFITPLKFTGKVHFAAVSFGYDPQRPVLNAIDLIIPACSTVALVGRSGSGKSTLIKLLFRYFEPQSGRILIDGQDIRDLEVRAYRQRLGIVHQEVDVFNGTILENLTYANPNASPEAVAAACEIAQVDAFIDHLPHGYGTMVGERGVRLSGGQRQRLGIARALLADPDVLVFDEATSSLDYESEQEIQRALHRIAGTRTMLIIAHRLSTVRDADQIIVLDQGRIQEVGSHDELLIRDGIYAHLYRIQAGRPDTLHLL
ncbi:ABC transporter ATP-binding protein [Synechococcus sp. PCC 6312]|uniref:ABC transporter ATP-binding protein n=1 Tax=Synechococcus sp. (strain ATCC 27167 / PCC 6312) TaxID=195253 RepID=UPI00029F17F8|nr:ABC transporter ATP-binding protein [Synechococcus sp. PCC 6312]AFY59942.1 ABC-type multidrug transport system, ATPase and permease component [Synechococcus sp. PCC 6312]